MLKLRKLILTKFKKNYVVVEVFDIHKEIKAVATCNPSIRKRGLAPVKHSVRRATRSCKREDSTATAIT